MKHNIFVIFLCSVLVNGGCIAVRQNRDQFPDRISLLMQEQKLQNETQKEIKTKLMELEKMIQDIEAKLNHAVSQKSECQISGQKEISTSRLDKQSEILEFMENEKLFEPQNDEDIREAKPKLEKIDENDQTMANLEEDSGKIHNQIEFNLEKINAAQEIEQKRESKENLCIKHKNMMPDNLYERALQAINKQEYEVALGFLGEMTTCFEDHKLISSAYFWYGEACYQLQDFENAVKNYNKVIKDCPESSKYPAALLRSGLSDYAMGNIEEGQQRLEELIRKFSNRAEAKRAELFLENR